MGIKTSLGGKISVLVSLALLCVIGVMARLVFTYIEDSRIHEMTIRAEFFARSAREALIPKPDRFALIYQVQQVKKEEKAAVYAEIEDARGMILSSTDPSSIGEADQTEAGRRALSAQDVLTQTLGGGRKIDIAVPIFAGKNKIAIARVGFTRKSIAEAMAGAKTRIFLIALASLLFGVLGTILIVRKMTRALLVLAKAAEEVRLGNLNVSVASNSRDEIGALARSFNAMVLGLKEREFIRSTFGKYVSPQVAEAALKGKLKLGGENIQVTVLMTDIRNFTATSEKMPPEKVVEFLNAFLTRMVRVISAHGGVVDKFIGDAILAVFGAPNPLADHPQKAVEAALAMRAELAKMNAESAARGGGALKTGTSIHTGEAVAGNVGSPDRMSYTVIGDTVNLVARLEELNKKFGTDIILSSETVRRVSPRGFGFRSLGTIDIRGRKDPAEIYTIA